MRLAVERRGLAHLSAHLPPISSRARIGLMGGSFDPPHSGHMHVAQTALKKLQLDGVLWIVAKGNPLKSWPESPFDVRLIAARLLTETQPKMHVTALEERAGLTYSIDLVRLLQRRCRNNQFVWLMGADTLTRFHHWKAWKALAHKVPIAVISRPHDHRLRSSKFEKVLKNARRTSYGASGKALHYAPGWVFITARLNHESSTQLRNGQ